MNKLWERMPLWISVCLAVLLFGACGKQGAPEQLPAGESSRKSPPPSGPDVVRLTFTYGSEKEKWISAVTESFNASRQKTASGKVVFVDHLPMGSGECIDEIVSGKRETHLASPASAVFFSLGNAESRAKLGRDLVGKTENLVLSPVVIAMWKPMAEALGWPDHALGWNDIHEMAVDDKGWASRNYPQWGRFRFGHTHPEYSNSGLIALVAETYAGAGKQRGLTLDDVGSPATGQYLEEIERAIVHYGRSTGFFGRKMFSTGPEYLSAAVLYENMVIESYDEDGLPFPVVPIYPKEGTFYSDHPVGIVDRDYVTPEHREAAEQYIAFLTDTPQQERAIDFGFRPGDINIALGDRFSDARGVDPKQPMTTLEVPEVTVTKAILNLWHERKKKSNIALVLDTSGSMKDEGKMASAKSGAKQLVAMLGDKDRFSFLPFNNVADRWLLADQPVGPGRVAILKQVDSLFAEGGTALYDAVSIAHAKISTSPGSDKINAIVVLSDGADSGGGTGLPALLRQISTDAESATGGVRIFTIGYGSGARADILEKIAEASRGKYYKGTPQNIEQIFKEISTFF